MILDSIRTFIQEQCPLARGKRLKVNRLGDKPQAFCIETVPTTPVIRRYADGGSMRQYLFIFASREFYDEETRSALNIAGFYEDFSDWLENGGLPELGDGLTALRFEVLSSGYLFRENSNDARYQIQCRLIYEKKGF